MGRVGERARAPMLGLLSAAHATCSVSDCVCSPTHSPPAKNRAKTDKKTKTKELNFKAKLLPHKSTNSRENSSHRFVSTTSGLEKAHVTMKNCGENRNPSMMNTTRKTHKCRLNPWGIYGDQTLKLLTKIPATKTTTNFTTLRNSHENNFKNHKKNRIIQ